MIARILLDPETTAEGTTTDTAETKVAAVVPPVVKPDPNKVTLDKASYDAELAELTRLRSEQDERIRKAREIEDEKARQKGDYEDILKRRNDDLKAKDAQIVAEQNKLTAREADFARAIASRDLIASFPATLGEGSAEQLSVIFAGMIESRPDGNGGYETVSKDGKPVKDFVAGMLAQPAYAKFLRAENRGGAGGGGGDASPSKATTQHATLGDAMLARMKAAPAKGGTMGNPFARN